MLSASQSTGNRHQSSRAPSMGAMADSYLVNDESDASLPESESPAELPSDAETEVALPNDPKGCCKMECLAALEENSEHQIRVSELHDAMDKLTKADQDRLRFDCLRNWASKEHGWRKHVAWGIPLCRDAVCATLKISKTVLKKMTQHITEGFAEPPMDMRRAKVKGGTPAQQDATVSAQTMLSWLHENVAEVLVESADPLRPKKYGNICLDVGQAACRIVRPEEVRFMPPHTSLQEMYDTSLSMLQVDPVPHYQTFVKVFHRDWEDILKFRHEGQHMKCSECERYKQWRRVSHAPEDIKKINAEHAKHLHSMMKDRQTYKAIMMNPNILCCDIDSMDCAKWRMPRNLTSSKQFEGLWRPEATFTAVLTNTEECFYLMEQDVVKDSNLMVTLLSRTIHRAMASAETQPDFLHIHSDNAVAEVKNQHTLKWGAMMLRSFKVVTFSQFRVGHSHGAPDERFACIRTLLANSPVLETPEAFIDKVSELKPRGNRKVHVEKVDISLDWKECLEPLAEFNLSGHVQTKAMTQQDLEATHVFQLMTRKTFLERNSSGCPEIDELSGYTPNKEDIILEVWHYMASPQRSQNPMVFIPAGKLNELGPSLLCAAGRRQLSERQRKEFRKTAQVVADKPWNLRAAQKYLESFVENNSNPEKAPWQSPDISWIWRSSSLFDPPEPEGRLQDSDLSFGNRAPAVVSVQPKKTACKTKAGPGRPKGKAKSKPNAKAKARSKANETEAELPQSPESQTSLPEAAAVPTEPPTQSSKAAGCPENMRGRQGAPERAVHSVGDSDDDPPIMKRPAAKILKRPAAAAAAPKPEKKRKQLGRLPHPEGVSVGCTKCRWTTCPRCRERAGLVLNEDSTAWILKQD